MNGDLRILLLEDEPTDAEIELRELSRAGLAYVATRVEAREPFVDALRTFDPDLILSDYHLPAFDGRTALALAREIAPDVPFIFVSGAMGEERAIESLHQGAADYVLKDRLAKLAPAVARALETAKERRQRRRAEAKLADSEQRFRTIAESMQDALVIVERDGAVTFWNRAAERMFGHAAHDVLGRRFDMLLPAAEAAGFDCRWRAFRDAMPHEVDAKRLELTACRANGETFPVELSVSTADIDGVWHAIASIRDISGRRQAEQALRRSNRFLRTLSRCNEALVHATDEQSLLYDMCRTVVEAGGFALAWVGYVEGDGDATIRPMAHAGACSADYVAGLRLTWRDSERGQGPSGRAVRTGEIQVVQDIAADPRFAPWAGDADAYGFKACASLPLKAEGRTIGILSIYSEEAGIFNEEESGLLAELAADLAFGITTLRMRAQQAEGAARLSKGLEETIRAIATTIEMRDPYTAGHQRRVARLAATIATAMGLSEERVKGVLRGAEIHDIGKIYIPAEILNRPGRLTPIEFKLIETHPQVGYDIVKDIDFPWPLRDMILQHHERIDGTGYPHGLAGDEILLEARIISVADVVEAMMNHRPYRPALGLDAALDEIRHGRGRAFDAEAVDACIAVIREGAFSYE